MQRFIYKHFIIISVYLLTFRYIIDYLLQLGANRGTHECVILLLETSE